MNLNTTMEQLSSQIKAYDESATITFMDADGATLTEGILKTGYKMKVTIVEKPAEPEIPEEPSEPETPVEPEVPTDPVEPEEPETPEEPVNPDVPEQPVEPDQPVDPEIPVEPDPEIPTEPETPENLEETNLEEQISTISEPIIKECTFILSVNGDVNGDGKISSVDYVMVKNHILNIKTIKGSKSLSADVNFDKKISSIDYVMIKNHILKISEIK